MGRCNSRIRDDNGRGAVVTGGTAGILHLIQRGGIAMVSAMMVDRTGMGMTGMGTAGVNAGPMGATAPMPTGMNMMMVPRCTLKMEKCNGGMMITCSTDD